MQVWLIILKLYFYFNISQSHPVALIQSLLSVQWHPLLIHTTWDLLFKLDIRSIWKIPKDWRRNEVLNTSFVPLHDAKTELWSHDLKVLHRLLSLCIPLRTNFFESFLLKIIQRFKFGVWSQVYIHSQRTLISEQYSKGPCFVISSTASLPCASIRQNRHWNTSKVD